MPKFIPYDYNQSSMVVINYQDQLQTGTFEYAVHYLIEKKLDLSVFYPKYKNDDNGRPAYDPAILLKIILFAYSKGITSSREIEWCCKTNIIFKALSCDTVPHFTTIAAFVSERSKEIETLFEQVLLVCDEEGLLGNELFAIDGCKMPSNAAKEWSGTFKELEQKRTKTKRQIRHHINEHKQLDKNESSDEERAKRAKRSIDTLNKAHDKIDQFLKSNSPRQGFNGLASVDKKHQIIIDAQVFGSGQEHHTLKPILESISERFKRIKINKDIYKTKIVVTADTGFANEKNMQYLHEHNINAYIPDNQFRSRDPKFKDQKTKYGKRHQNQRKTNTKTIPATEFGFDPVNLTCCCPAGNMLSLRSQNEDEYGNHKAYFEGRLTQCRNCIQKHRCMRNPAAADHRKGNGRQVSFILEKKPRKANYTDWMKHRVDSPKGKLIYSHRMSVVEPVFGNIGTNKKLNRFSLRGKQKVQGRWQLYCLVHNIEKLANYTKMVA